MTFYLKEDISRASEGVMIEARSLGMFAMGLLLEVERNNGVSTEYQRRILAAYLQGHKVALDAHNAQFGVGAEYLPAEVQDLAQGKEAMLDVVEAQRAAPRIELDGDQWSVVDLLRVILQQGQGAVVRQDE